MSKKDRETGNQTDEKTEPKNNSPVNNYDSKTIKQMENLLNVGIALSAEKEHNKVLEMILTEARHITGADAGTLYLCSEDNHLLFKIAHNDTLGTYQGGDGEKVDLPPLPIQKDSVAGYTAITKEVVNIPDVYNSDKFDFSGPKKYDKMTGYKSVSMLVAPLEDHEGKVVGVLQLINATDEEGKVNPFATYYEKVISSLASQAAVSINNISFLEEIENLLRAFVESMATAVDARTPYNASHTLRIARMIGKFIEGINKTREGRLAEEYFDEDRKEQLIMGAWLHDIGKIAVPLSVMNKASRLEGSLKLVLQRFDFIELQLRNEINRENDKNTREDSRAKDPEQMLNLLKEARSLIKKADSGDTFVDEEMIEKISDIGSNKYYDLNGVLHNWLTDEEKEALSVSRGTLTAEERKIIEDHVNVGQRILQGVPFPARLNRVLDWVGMHHEYLDGSGYPEGLKGKDIPLEARMMTIVDIFDALVAADRPYKKPKPVGVALNILASMVKEGKLDSDLLEVFKKYEVWEVMKLEKEDSYRIW